MDYLPSGLADKLEASHTLPEEVAIRIGIDVARALGFAHREGVVHRDIKVDNILFDVHGNAVVADFGIARAVSGYTQQTGTNMVVGTPQYFSPEQARAKPLDGRADIYSLGVSLFRTVTGRLPFEGEDWYEIARAHVEEAPPKIRSLNPAISGPFERMVAKCLAKHPDDRPATGEQLADDLTAILALPRTGSAPSGIKPSWASPNESPTLVSAAPGSRRRFAVLLPFAVAVAAVGAVAFPFVVKRFAVPPAAVGDTVLTPPESVATPDSTVTDTTQRPDSGIAQQTDIPAPRPDPTKPAPKFGSISLSGPEGSVLSINGEAVTGSPARADSLLPGTYIVRATIPAVTGCESATDEATVRVRAGAVQRTTLTPRPCGVLEVIARNAGDDARFSLVTREGRRYREGTLSTLSGAVIPIGEYTLRVERPGCDVFSAPLSVTPAPPSVRVPFTLNCRTEAP